MAQAGKRRGTPDWEQSISSPPVGEFAMLFDNKRREYCGLISAATRPGAPAGRRIRLPREIGLLPSGLARPRRNDGIAQLFTTHGAFDIGFERIPSDIDLQGDIGWGSTGWHRPRRGAAVVSDRSARRRVRLICGITVPAFFAAVLQASAAALFSDNPIRSKS